MASKTLVSLLVLAGLSHGQYNRYGPIRKNITWTSCVTVSAPPGFLCGEFDVPLDYTDVTRGKATLALIKYPSTVQPRKGTIFLNPGGPGEPGLDFLISTGPGLSNSSGGNTTSVGHIDPRGVGLSYPRIRCFNSTAEQASFWQGTAPSQLSSGLLDKSKGNFSNADGTDPNELAFWKQEPLVDYLLLAVGQKCWAENGDHLSYVGTAAVTRDIVAMHDIIEGPGSLINYWGYSYGTVIGNFLVNSELKYHQLFSSDNLSLCPTVFPHRVGRVILDGVLNPIFWSDVPSYKIWACKHIHFFGSWSALIPPSRRHPRY
ncbi:hypothetical protein BS47DRAFT_1292897 [Hydnum rufescens UP504]|uniref:AB hydrolase-1 domain-containing protein n=1 Tax=Hydnum rufescens UP504 TaxID=1448309 RepID=A0A9P6DYX9_9AGAM|nr:hypothetical protein BS47DRAFT_1292897 [Hydnum rufescens UP504]